MNRSHLAAVFEELTLLLVCPKPSGAWLHHQKEGGVMIIRTIPREPEVQEERKEGQGRN